jgi:hypothetical protein
MQWPVVAGSRQSNTKLPMVTISDAIPLIVSRSDRCPQLGFGELPLVTRLANGEALRWSRRARQAGNILWRESDPEWTDPRLVFTV